MKHPLLISLLWLVSACGTTPSNSSVSTVAAAPSQSPLVYFTHWDVDPAVGLGADEEITDSWVRVKEETKQLSAQIRWDLFPFSFESTIVSDSTDDCGHRHIIGRLDGTTPQTSAFRSTDMDLTFFNLTTSSLHCRTGIENEVILVLKTESHEGLKTASTLYKGAAAPVPAADYSCRATNQIDEYTSEVFEILFSKRLRFDLQPHIPVAVYVQSRIESLVALQPSPWSMLVAGETARMAMTDDGDRTLTFPSGVLNLEPGNSGIAGTLDSLRGTLELSTKHRSVSVDVFCIR